MKITTIIMNIMSIDAGVLKLMQALDSLFPIGAFTLSNGMETYTQKEIVTDGASLSAFLDAYLYTLPYNDGGFAAKAAIGTDHRLLDEICAASRSPYELRSGSSKLCARFIKAENSLGDYSGLKKYAEDISAGICGGYHCIAVGIFMRDIGIDVSEGLCMYFYSLLSSLVNHAVKLVPLRQLDGQKSLSTAMDKIPSAAEKALAADISELGISGGGFDLRSMQHEKLYSRIYIS